MMSDIKLTIDNRGRGAFVTRENGKQLGEMVVGISETTMTVYHTEVNPEMEGKGLAKELFDEMVGYAREHSLQVVPLCEYVLLQFRRHPDDFQDIWKK